MLYQSDLGILQPRFFIDAIANMSVALIAASSILYFSGAAVNVLLLQNKKFTHILNVAMGKSRFHSNTNHVMYRKVGIEFLGKYQIDLNLNGKLFRTVHLRCTVLYRNSQPVEFPQVN